MKKQKTIIVVGGGVGGLELVTRLGNSLGKSKIADIILVDRYHSHIWKPILHEVASGSINTNLKSISYFNHAYKNYFQFYLGELQDVDKERKTITISTMICRRDGKIFKKELKFDILVIALGSISNDFSIEGVKKYCIFLDNLEQANLLRNKMINLFIAKSSKREHKFDEMKIAIVGGGATGIELCAELLNTLHYLNKYKFEGYNNYQLKIYLLEAENRILPSLSESISQDVHNELEKIGISVLTKTKVNKVSQSELQTSSSKKIHADLIVWAAGIKVQDFIKRIDGISTNRINQIIVQPTLQSISDDTIFAIGDCAFLQEDKGGYVPPRAQAAHQMANICYKNILSMLERKKLKKYLYKDRGFLISLSKFNTVGSIFVDSINKEIPVCGKIARILYLSLYRRHQVTIQGLIRTGLSIVSDNLDKYLRSNHLNLY
ncbi:NAD(P)/FAD-dependent oxidoreductase [Candidatus Riesia pediculischaeffi]|uniref:NADH dehydrogenase n=1 Tax=Candidatus Riesia pediculischaeffi PTSU TaxID=1401651 RepID=A0A0C1V7T1_9ENTR|nr:NAD(P)/FAD-dependent oxidoreductase [Candidatus Riesia pediculischaeffi]KIE63888.1 NADH dehydrogenase [Candidatus Riesia pediculischaeffi PTSU]